MNVATESHDVSKNTLSLRRFITSTIYTSTISNVSKFNIFLMSTQPVMYDQKVDQIWNFEDFVSFSILFISVTIKGGTLRNGMRNDFRNECRIKLTSSIPRVQILAFDTVLFQSCFVLYFLKLSDSLFGFWSECDGKRTASAMYKCDFKIVLPQYKLTSLYLPLTFPLLSRSEF